MNEQQKQITIDLRTGEIQLAQSNEEKQVNMMLAAAKLLIDAAAERCRPHLSPTLKVIHE